MKGFTHVLEGILAAFLLIGAVTTVVPEIETGSASRTEFSGRVWNLLHSLDRTGELRDRVRDGELADMVSETIPSSYQTKISLVETDYRRKDFEVSSGSVEKQFNVSGEDFEIQLWLESASNINVSFAGRRLLTKVSEDGYYLRPLTNGSGNLTVNGTGTVRASLNGYVNEGAVTKNSSVQSVKYVDAKNSTVQIGVFSWK